MVSSVTQAAKKSPGTSLGQLPPHMHALFVTGPDRIGGWLADALAAECDSQIVLEQAEGLAAGVARLGDELFDAVLISHDGRTLNALEWLDGIRAGASEEQAIVVLGSETERDLSALCCEAGADAYVCVNTATTRTLIWAIARAVERRRLIAENRRMKQAQRHRLQVENDEAARLLAQQRALVVRPASPCDESDPRSASIPDGPRLPDQLLRHYRELLRAYVIMGSGNLRNELTCLSELLAAAGVTAPQAMHIHVSVLEELIRGLGCRSARHVVTRADLLVLELLINLAESYRRRFVDHLHPPHQLSLPGFGQDATA